MTKEVIIATLEQLIRTFEVGLKNHSGEKEQQQIEIGLEDAKDLLKQVRTADDETVRQISEILEQH
jgi:hypothetical protein